MDMVYYNVVSNEQKSDHQVKSKIIYEDFSVLMPYLMFFENLMKFALNVIIFKFTLNVT